MILRKLYIYLLATLFFCALVNTTTNAQNEAASGEVFFNYGSATGGVSQYYFSSFTIGQPVVGSYFGTDYQGALGFWSRFLVAPAAPLLVASEGDYSDRILLEWGVDPLSPASDLGFKIFRDGAFLASLDPSTLEFIDFNVIPGNFYNYEVRGVNIFGDGYPAQAVGFVNPNGSVTGQVTSINGNPVADVQVTLEPTIGKSLAFENGTAVVELPYHAGYTNNELTVSTWVKIGDNNVHSGIVDLGKQATQNWYILTNDTDTNNKGVTFGIGESGARFVEESFEFGADPDGWHHLAFTYNGSDLNMYIDGVLQGTQAAAMDMADLPLTLGRGFDGNIDDVRIYNRQLSQTEIVRTMNATVPSTADGLVAYWKLDEGIGEKVFDLAENQLDGFITGATFSNDRPNVLNAGITDESGYYLIDGINYGGGQNFTARPSKDFEFNNALEFNKTAFNYATIDSLFLSDTAGISSYLIPKDTGTIELWFKPSSLTGSQTILANGAVFDLSLNGNSIDLSWGSGSAQSIGTISEPSYTHIAITYTEGGAPNLVTYINGQNPQSLSGNSISNWADQWVIGRNTSGANYYTGLVDEIAFYNTARTQAEIQLDAATVGDTIGVQITDLDLLAFFSLNESVGTSFTDQSPNNTGQGIIYGASWTNVTARPETVPHEFSPVSRIVTLNPSSTGIDNVDFQDISTVSVSGFVRYAGTQCFAEQTEILVNGRSHSPPIFTNEDGYFVADFEPGASFRLSPSFEEHHFIPAFWDITNIIVPKAGIVFNDQTTRDVEGIVAGGLCEYSIIPAGGKVKINLLSANECFNQTIEIDEGSGGSFKFNNVPPIPYTVAVIDHPISNIKEALLAQGTAIDLSDRDTSIAFIYREPISIDIEPLATNCLGDQMVEKFKPYDVKISVYENYFGQHCLLDTVDLNITNNVAGITIDTSFAGGKLTHNFYAGTPNISSPFTKSITVTATDPFDERTTSENTQMVIIGRSDRVANFTTTSPELPITILRDPPGDQSYSYLKSGDQICQYMSINMENTQDETEMLNVSLGPEVEIGIGSGFVTAATTFDATLDISSGLERSATYVTESEQEVCITATTDLQTNNGEVVVGSEMGGDVFVGAAMNLIVGVTDVLSYNDSCGYELSEEPFVRNGGFETMYMYTEDHIKNTLIPTLISHDSLESAAMWEQVVAKNESTKMASVFEENLSFDAGVVYEYTKETEATESSTYSWNMTIADEQALEIGFTAGGIGSGFERSIRMETSWGGSTQTTQTSTTEVGYHLEDNDIGDAFSIDVREDRVFGTPVFDLKAGISSCPHEPGTTPKDEPTITVEQSVISNVPETEPAVFNFNLGNQSQAGEGRVYLLEFNADSNPLGAIVNINGQPTTDPLEFEVPFGESIPITVTVEKGPDHDDYENLELIYYAQCERERSLDYNVDEPTDSLFEKHMFFNAHFIPSCSAVEIGSPNIDWVITPATGDTMSITINGFDTLDLDLQMVKVQFRRIGGNGAWVNIADIPVDSIEADFHIVQWDVTPYSDGPFELRATSQCQGGLLASSSTIIPGRLERQPPELLGTPSPADGILHASDQIYIEFTENIDCSNLTSLTGALENYVGLFWAQTNEAINFDISCNENRIYLDPVIANGDIENQLLRAEVRGIKDFIGNTIEEPITWEFYVDRNPLKWVEGDIIDVKYDDDSWLVTRSIRNTGGQTEAFTLENIPDWLNISTTAGEIAPGASAVIVFTVPDQIASGHYQDTIQLHNNMGDEPLVVDLGALCRPPIWEVTPSAYDYNMTFTLSLNIEGEVSEDEFDQVAAYVGDDLRGTAIVEYVPSLDSYLAFLTVYSNQIDGEELSFRIWDASDCLLYGSVVETYDFTNDGLYGTPDNPDTLHTQNIVLKEIPVHEGWNWISFNLDMPDKSIGAVLESLDYPEDVLVKDQVSFSQYFNALDIWAGSLQHMGYTSMYQFKGTQNDTITLLGHPIDPDTVDIPIYAGWNWIGYLPQQGASVDHALSALTPLDGDIVKNQYEFAQYVSGIGWIGSLSYMEAPNGYLLKASTPGILKQITDPVTIETPQIASVGTTPPMATTRSSIWNVNPSEFEHSMTIVGVVEASGENMLKSEDEVAAFVDGEVRGAATSLYIEQLDIHLLFLTVYSNDLTEEMEFKYYDAAAESIYEIQEQLTFVANGSVGTVGEPEIFTLEFTTSTTAIADKVSLSVQPNPFSDKTNLNFVLPQADEITINVLDILGNVVKKDTKVLTAGEHMIELLSVNDEDAPLANGTYYISIEGQFGKVSEKVLLVR